MSVAAPYLAYLTSFSLPVLHHTIRHYYPNYEQYRVGNLAEPLVSSDFRKIFFLQIPVENAWQFYSDFINFIHKGKDTVNVTLHFSFSMNNHASARILTVVYSVQACIWSACGHFFPLIPCDL